MWKKGLKYLSRQMLWLQLTFPLINRSLFLSVAITVSNVWGSITRNWQWLYHCHLYPVSSSSTWVVTLTTSWNYSHCSSTCSFCRRQRRKVILIPPATALPSRPFLSLAKHNSVCLVLRALWDYKSPSLTETKLYTHPGVTSKFLLLIRGRLMELYMINSTNYWL